MGHTASRSDDLYFRPVEESRLKEFIHNVRWFGNIYAGTNKEFKHYYAKKENAFYELLDGITKDVIGTVCVISNGNKSLVSGVTLEKSYAEYGTTFPIDYRMMYNKRNRINYPFLCANIPFDIEVTDTVIGYRFWKIFEYYIDLSRLEEIVPPYPDYDVGCIKDPTDIEQIVRFDRRCFPCFKRRDFLETCARRSDAVYVVRKGDEMQGFGMLSKPKDGKRLLGPVYARNFLAACPLIDNLLVYAKGTYTDLPIVAYVPENSLGSVSLTRSGFSATQPPKVWNRISICDNYHINETYIVSLGSIIFDVC